MALKSVARGASRAVSGLRRAGSSPSGCGGSAAVACAVEMSARRTPWPLPSASLSPKGITDADRSAVSAALKKFGGDAGIEAASQPPASWYLSDSFARAELGGVFPRTWQYACRALEVRAPGDFMSTFTGSGEPVLVLRDERGVLRAFANVCAHHAARVAEGSGSGATSFVCPYHAWTYNLQGRLVKATRMTGVSDFKASKVGLAPLEVEEWGPFVFVRTRKPLQPPGAEGPAPWERSVAEQLAPAVADMDAMAAPIKWSAGDWKSLHFLRRRVYDIPCNWKVYIDNYLDGGYHIPHLHLGLAGELDMGSYKTELHPSVSVQKCRSSPVQGARIGGEAVYAFMFPNFAINRYGDWLDTNLVLPVAVDRCVIVFDWFHRNASPTQNAAENAALLSSLGTSRAIQDEDIYISESVQCGLGSPAFDRGRYAPGVEIAEYHFHRLMRDIMRTSDAVARESL